MKLRRALLGIVLGLVASIASTGPLLADVYVAPPPLGSNLLGDGTQSAPYATIQFAYDVIPLPGETIRVLPGTYTECIVAAGVQVEVAPGVFSDKWVNLVADDPDPTQTTIQGLGVCNTLEIGGTDGSLEGFTITNGFGGGIFVFGTATIRDNVITGNNGVNGGGIVYESRTCVYGEGILRVTNNVITDNTAQEDGGGMFIEAGIDPFDCQLATVKVYIEDNTIEDNTSFDDGAGFLVRMDTFPATSRAETYVNDNTIRFNQAIGTAGSGEAGGARVSAEGIGIETAVIRDNVFQSNTAVSRGGGLQARAFTDVFADHRLRVLDNTITFNNAGDEGGGLSIEVTADALVDQETISVIATGNTVSNNFATGDVVGGGGIFASWENTSTAVFEMALGEFIVSNNVVRDNFAQNNGGGMALVLDANPGCVLTSLPASVEMVIENNMVTGNEAAITTPQGAGGGIFLLQDACISSSTSARFRLNTIADNLTGLGAGGIEIKKIADLDSSNSVDISHNIVASNQRFGLGGDNPIGTSTVTVDYNDVWDNGIADYVTWIGDRTGSDGNFSTNPEFENPASGDYRLSVTSPAIDAGSQTPGIVPELDFELDPRVVDGDGAGPAIIDIGCDEYFVCTDGDNDNFGDPISPGDFCTQDNCPLDFNPGQSDCDGDLLGDSCDPDTIDLDGDGVDAACDPDDTDSSVCGDLDADGCDDCLTGFSNPAIDGPDFDADDICDVGDPDNDNDGALDGDDSHPLDPFRCGDTDADGCEDCVTGVQDIFNDGPDADGDGVCAAGDVNDSDPNVCGDIEPDGCEDCGGIGVFDPFNDGPDFDGDGLCDPGDPDDDNDNVPDGDDLDPFNANVCRDADADTCDDCTSGVDDVLNDGLDTDLDGLCNPGDPDDDNDTVLDGDDCAPLVNSVSGPAPVLGATQRHGPAKDDVRWLNVPNANVFNVYRGEIGGGAPFSYVHSCLFSEVPALNVTTPAPPPGRLRYYLISATNACSGDGGLGTDSAGNVRPPFTPCFGGGADSDLDGIQDISDNCPLEPNPNQFDPDLDGIGTACDNCFVVSNPQQGDTDTDGAGDACDTCTDTDGDGAGNEGFPANTCALDNCPFDPNPNQFDGDGDGLGNACDVCPQDPGNDDDVDGVCAADDNCVVTYNPGQGDLDNDSIGDACDTCTDPDGDGFGNANFPASTCPDDNCPFANNTGQEDADGDGEGDVCDSCTDLDGDGFGDAGFFNSCPDDNCPALDNPAQTDLDLDGLGDVCDDCPGNDDLLCVPCPDSATTDPDGDGFCQFETIAVEEGTAIDYLANSTDPGIGFDWVAGDYQLPGNWLSGFYGIGYELAQGFPNSSGLITTTVPDFSLSVYTRATFNVADVSQVKRVRLGADYDDGYIAWLNGQEIYRSPEMPADPIFWNTAPAPHEASNFEDPDYGELIDLTALVDGVLVDGDNVLAVGIWNRDITSNDLVLVPRLSYNTTLDNCPNTPNFDQADADADGLGDACDPCFANPDTACVACPNPAVTDPDGDGVCEIENVAAEEGTAMFYLANSYTEDPGIGLDWIVEDYVTDPSWQVGVYGIGFDTSPGFPTSLALITTTVPDFTASAYTRWSFDVTTAADVERFLVGADYDDGYIVWVNGQEVYRSPEMPPGDPDFDTLTTAGHEASNQQDPDYGVLNDVTAAATAAIHDGENDVAIGIWNRGNTSGDLILVPRVSFYTSLDNCPNDANPGQEDGDGDGIGDACDPSP